MVAAGILLSACGSNSKADPIPTPTPPPGGYAFMNFTSKLTIDEYKTYPIRFQLTKNGLAVPDAEVFMKIPDQSIGSIRDSKVITDENGKGAFVYTPPAVFPEKGQLFVVYTDGNITLQETVKLSFDLKSDIPSEGRPTTLSISYRKTECKDESIIGYYSVHAVDRFGRPPVVPIPVRVSLVNGIKIINNDIIQKGTGHIAYSNPSDISSPIVFSDGSVDYAAQTEVKAGDNLIIFPSQGRTHVSYIGGWDIKTVSDILTLNEQYNNLVQDGSLTYMIGNEERLLGGRNGEAGRLAVAHVEPDYTTDNNGFAYFEINFDPILAGHTVTVEAHGNEDGHRVGVAQKVALRWDDFTAPDIKVSNSGGTEVAYIPLTIDLQAQGCSGNQPLIDVPVNPNSFKVDPSKHCQIDKENSRFYSDAYGSVKIVVNTDGNISDTGGTDDCTIKWDGGITSLLYEY